ncbi:MAG: hypothetical protein JXR78_14180 [Victivallales bacterium]|nr:hypothetical protein [Victivallales bacterium]
MKILTGRFLNSSVLEQEQVSHFSDNLFNEVVSQDPKGFAVAPAVEQELSVEQVNPEKFIQARSMSARSQFLTPYTEQQLSEFELYLIGENAGYALTPEKDLVNLFNNSDVSGAGAEALIDAISKGVKTLSCFSGFLCSYYVKFGFIETARRKWDDRFAPDSWDFRRYGCPDVVDMVYKGDRNINRLRYQVVGARNIDQRRPQAKPQQYSIMNLSIS